MLTDGVTVGLIVIVIPVEVAGLPVTVVRLDVMVHVTTDPVASVVVVHVASVAPDTALPLTFH
jgi:hypothetical protein